jgi:phage terminase large subunit GpA-like protein
MTVTEATEKYVRIQAQGNWQRYDRHVTPYMIEPQDMTTSRRFKVIAMTAPSQCGKTQMLQNTIFHRVTCDQMPTLVVHMTKTDRNKWVEEKLNPQIQNSPGLKSRLGDGPNDDTFERKRFKGMRLAIGYPTPTVLSGDTRGLVVLTDYDHFPAVLGPKDRPEGSALGMSRMRVRSFMSRGTVLLEGSIAYPQDDPSWTSKKAEPHMLPPTTGGIAQVYNDGTRARWYWECPDCSEEFEPRFDLLEYDAELSPGECGEVALMVCPHCGSCIDHRHKVELNRKTLTGKGGWRHEQIGGALCDVDDPLIRKTDIASYALNGAAAVFVSWSELVTNYETAFRKTVQLGDTTDLAQVYYTEIGLPFPQGVVHDTDEIGVEYLKLNARPEQRRVCPEWAVAVSVSVDVQKGYFAVQVMAWGLDGSAQVIDRFDISTPPEDAPNVASGDRTRRLRPDKYVEDWKVLEDLTDRVYVVSGHSYGLRPCAAVVDFQGEKGVSDNAERFIRRMWKENLGNVWFTSRGHGGYKVDKRVWYASPEGASKGKAARSIKLLNFATDRLKDTVWTMLNRIEGGVGALYPAQWQEDEQIAEFVAEEHTAKGWIKRKGMVRNESFDLSVMGVGLMEHKGLFMVDPERLPVWVKGGADNPFAVMDISEVAEGEAVVIRNEKARAPVRLPKKINYVGRR